MKNKTPKALPLAFQAIQEYCACYRGELTLRDHTFAKYKGELSNLRAKYLPILQTRAIDINSTRATLTTLIDANRPIFKNPKTRIFSDIKVGLRKLEGETVVADPEKTLELIAKHFPDRLDELAPITRALSKDALKSLTGAELKKIGVEITADTDAIIIKPMDSDVEKAVAALLKESAPELKAAA
jgi:hypothetical protein